MHAFIPCKACRPDRRRSAGFWVSLGSHRTSCKTPDFQLVICRYNRPKHVGCVQDTLLYWKACNSSNERSPSRHICGVAVVTCVLGVRVEWYTTGRNHDSNTGQKYLYLEVHAERSNFKARMHAHPRSPCSGMSFRDAYNRVRHLQAALPILPAPLTKRTKTIRKT